MQKHPWFLAPALALTLLLGGCSGLATDPGDGEEDDAPADDAPADEAPSDEKKDAEDDKAEDTAESVESAVMDSEEIEYRDFPPDVLFALLSAELAAQRGRYDVTLMNYAQSAADTQDPAVIRRAMQIAQALDATNAQRQIAEVWLKVDPENPQALRIAALAQLRQSNLDQALAYMEKLHEQDEDAQLDTLANQARALPADQQQTMLELYERLHERHPDSEAITYSLALLNDNTGNSERALELTNGLLEEKSNFQPAVTLKGKLLYDLERSDEAVDYLRQQARRFPENRRLGTLYARVLVNQGQLQAAEDEFEALMERFPDATGLKLSRALVALENDHHDIAEDMLNELLSEGVHTNQAHFYLGRLADKRENPNEALHHYSQVQGGNHFFQSLSRASYIRAEQGELEAVRNNLANLRSRLPDQSARLWQMEINLLLDLEQPEKALAVADSALDDNPDNTEIRYMRAMLREQTGDIEGMESDLREVLEAEPENAVALNALGYTLTVHTDRHDEAEELIMQALELDPENPAILDSAGWVHYRKGEPEEALEYLGDAYERLPDPEIAAHLGRVLWELDRREEARTLWRRTLEETDNTDALEPLLEILEELDLEPEGL
ncbi:MAG: tetratricopeptide repeat protein [Pseudomonadota bacterium]